MLINSVAIGLEYPFPDNNLNKMIVYVKFGGQGHRLKFTVMVEEILARPRVMRHSCSCVRNDIDACK